MRDYKKLIDLLIALAALFVASRMKNASAAAAFVGLSMMVLFWDSRPKE